MKSKLFTILCTVSVLMGCSKNGESLSGDDSLMKVSVEPSITRATELSFEENDQIGLSIMMESDNSMFVENSLMSYDGSKFTSEGLIWYDDVEQFSTLTAYYPYSNSSTAPASFTVLSDQTADGAYSASDLMLSSVTGVTPTVESVGMTFKHALSRIVIDIDNQSRYSISSVEICGSYATATVDHANLSVEADNTSSVVDIKAPLWDDATYKAIIVPQTVALTFKVTLSTGSVLSTTKSSVSFASGSQYSASITMTDESIDLFLSGDIDDWTEGGEIPDATTDDDDNFVDYPEDEKFVYYGVEYNTITLENGTRWMADNLRYIPEGFTPSSNPTENSNIWYPYDLSTLTGLTDDESIDTNGYLYNIYAAFGKSVTQDTEIEDFEGLQGICPDGWHIPTRIEWFDLVGRSNANKYLGESGTQLNEDALFYNEVNQYGSKSLANEAGFNMVDAGVRMATSFTATGSYQGYYMSYYMSSTFYYNAYSTTAGDTYGNWTNAQFYAPMIYSDGRITLAYMGVNCGAPVRCIQDSDKVYAEIEATTTPSTRPTSDNPTGV